MAPLGYRIVYKVEVLTTIKLLAEVAHGDSISLEAKEEGITTSEAAPIRSRSSASTTGR